MKLCGVFAVVLCAAATSFGAITVSDGVGIGSAGCTDAYTLTYGDVADLSSTIDPTTEQYNVTESFGVAKAAFQALNPQVVAFNSPIAKFNNPTDKLIVANTVTFDFPKAGNYAPNFSTTVGYNYGGADGSGRNSFSGSQTWSDMSTVPSKTDDGLAANALDIKVSGIGGQGVAALGFCLATRTGSGTTKALSSPVIFTLSDIITGAVSTDNTTIVLPDFGGATTHNRFFIGYQAPAGKVITRVEIRDSDTGFGAAGTYNMTMGLDDLAFVMTPEPATMALVALGSLFVLRRRRA